MLLSYITEYIYKNQEIRLEGSIISVLETLFKFYQLSC